MAADELTELLRNKPLEFMKRYAMTPPSDAGSSTVPDPNRVNEQGQQMNMTVMNQTSSPRRTLWNDPGGVIRVGQGTISHQRILAGGVQHAKVVESTDLVKHGAKTLKLKPVPSPSRVPIHFLPWGSEMLMDMKIPDCGADMDDPENPNIFFTAALSGCSVFVDGHPASPRVVHAGIDGKLNVTARGFWEERLVDLARLSGQPIDDHMRSIDKSMYGDTVIGRQYRDWLSHQYKDTLTIRGVSEWASVFGIRYGRLWSFYLQRNATVRTVKLLKKAEVHKRKHYNSTYYNQKETGLAVKRDVQKGKGLFSRDKSVYVLEQSYQRPMFIQEFYPNGAGEGNARIAISSQYSALF